MCAEVDLSVMNVYMGCIAMKNYTYIYICMQNHNDDTIKTSGHSSLEKYTSHFI